MNTRARVKALPVVVAASFGIGTFGNLSRAFAHDGHVAAKAQVPTGFDELELTVTEEGVTGMPESIEAGRYLVKVSGPASTMEMGPTGVIFLQTPDGIDAAQVFEDTMAAEGGPPEWYMQAHFGGGPSLQIGDDSTESWAVVDLTPGAWIATTVFGTTLGIDFEVTGEFPTDATEPESNVTIDLDEMTIVIADGELVAGDNLIALHNLGDQLHFVEVSSVPEGTTKEDIDAVMESFMTGTPAVDGIAEKDIVPLAYLTDISPGVSQWVPLTLEAGTFFLTCWVADTETGMPHAMMGMYDIVVVE